MPATVFDRLVRRAGLTPDRPAVTFLPSGAAWEHPVTWTYGRLRDEVARTANALAARGGHNIDPAPSLPMTLAGKPYKLPLRQDAVLDRYTFSWTLG